MNTPRSGSAAAAEPDSARADRVRVKNRRRRYLDLHPEYFCSPHLELADPLLHDRLVRRFQSAREREDEGKRRGYAGLLEAALVRSEAKMDAVRQPDPDRPLVYQRGPGSEIVGVERDERERVSGKEEGMERWRDVMGQRFLRGEDGDFEYAAVDGNEGYDDQVEEERGTQEEYFKQEEVQFLGEGKPLGETGVQDF